MFRLGLAMLAAIVAGFITFTAPKAYAFPVAAQPAMQVDVTSPLVVDVRHGGHYRGGYYRGGYRGYYRPYNRGYARYYGRRCANWGNNCRYRYRGYYYPYRWWLPAAGVGVAVAATNYNSKHKNWCRNHYRSYNPRNNTWVSNSGKVRQCVSPYRG